MARASTWTSLAVAFVAVGVALAVPLRSPSRAPWADGPVPVEVERVPLDRSDAARERIGALTYRGGLWLRSADPRFGGLSDLRVSPDGTLLHAVSDCGQGLSARLWYDAQGRLAGFSHASFVGLVGPDGRLLSSSRRDAESLVLNGPSLEVGFEGRGRILAYAASPPFRGPARLVATPDRLRRCDENGGIETMTLLDDHGRLLVCESRRRHSPDVPAWIGDGQSWIERAYPLSGNGNWWGRPFRPSAAATLSNGDVLVLERRFPPLGARVVRLARQDVLGGGPLHPREIARFESLLTLDNFEGIDVREGGAQTLVYLLSDDNHCAKRPGDFRGVALERTLLLMFALEP